MSEGKKSEGKSGDLELWADEIEQGVKRAKTWWARAEKIVRRYRDERPLKSEARRFNILWSNIKVLQPAVYSQTPKPFVIRRFGRSDPVARVACTLVERNLEFGVEEARFDDAMKLARDDRLLAGCGQVWLRYSPDYGDPQKQRVQITQSGDEYRLGDGRAVPENIKDAIMHDDMGPFIPGAEFMPVIWEKVCVDYVHHADFIWGDAGTWDTVPWVARRTYLTKKQIEKRFPKIDAEDLSYERLRYAKDRGDTLETDESPLYGVAPVWEIWDKDNKEVLWFSESFKSGFLDRLPDPLKLKQFFPCPKPLLATTGPGKLIPVPDYIEYQDQAQEIDELSARIWNIVKAIRVAGGYDATQDRLGGLLTATGDNEMVPVTNWALFAEKGGINGCMSFLPVEEWTKSLSVLYDARERAKGDLYEITGLSDIIRGQTNANETATAQQIKGQFASLRLQELQNEMARFGRDTLALMAEIMVEHYDPSRLAEIAGLESPEEQTLGAMAIQVLRDDKWRSFRIDIETDATVAPDLEREKQARVEFLAAAGAFIEKSLAVAQTMPQLAPLLGEFLLFGVRGFRVGRELEGKIEQAVARLGQTAQVAAQAAQEPEADHEAEKAKAELQLKAMEVQAGIKREDMKAMAGIRRDNAKAASDANIARMEAASQTKKMLQ